MGAHAIAFTFANPFGLTFLELLARLLQCVFPKRVVDVVGTENKILPSRTIFNLDGTAVGTNGHDHFGHFI